MDRNTSDILASCVSSVSFLSGLIALILYFRQRVQRIRAKRSRFRHHRSTAARLPSLILFENLFYVCFLMLAVPLMILFWYYLPAAAIGDQQNNDDDEQHLQHRELYSTLGYVVFLVAFTPILQVHLVRIWLLQLRYHITSLSMQNQLGIVKWSDVRQKRWTRIYYQHKWTHDMRILLWMAVAFDVTLTILYFAIIYWQYMEPRILSGAIYGILSLLVVIAIVSLRSLQDPFRILAEEFSILLVWIAAIAILGVAWLTAFVMKGSFHRDDELWTFVVCFVASMAAVVAIVVHFYFDNKSLLVVKKNLPPLQVIVSTKEGLQTILRFLVTEFSVENLEFFTLTMRWRHRLVKRDERRQRRKSQKSQEQGQAAEAADVGHNQAITAVENAQENGTTAGGDNYGLSIEHPDTLSAAMTTADDKTAAKGVQAITIAELLANPDVLSPIATNKAAPNHKRHKQQIRLRNATQTHLKALPFPILTFEFLDHDVPKQKEQKKSTIRTANQDKLPQTLAPMLTTNRTFSDTSYVPEFSQTKTMMNDTNGHQQKALKKRTISFQAVAAPVPHSQMDTHQGAPPLIQRETMVSLYFTQYGFMEENRRRLSEYIKDFDGVTATGTSTASPVSHALNSNDTHHTPKTYASSRTSKLKRVLFKDRSHGGGGASAGGSSLNKQNSRSARSKLGKLATHTPTHEAVQDDSLSLKDYEFDELEKTAVGKTSVDLVSISSGRVPMARQHTDPNYITPFVGATAEPISMRENEMPTFTLALNKQQTTQIYGQGELKEAEAEDEEWDEDGDDEVGDEVEDGDGDGGGGRETAFGYSKQMQNVAPMKQPMLTTKASDTFHSAFGRQPSHFLVERLSVVQRQNSVPKQREPQRMEKIMSQSELSAQLYAHNRGETPDADAAAAEDGNKAAEDDGDDANGLVPVIRTQGTITRTVTLKSSEEKESITPEQFNFFDDDTLMLFSYDEEWTEEFMRRKKIDYDRLITLCADINVSHNARKKLQTFFNTYPTVRKFKNVDIAEYDSALEESWRDVWQNLNDSLRRFHQSTFYEEWLSSTAANGLNVVDAM